MDLNQNKNVLVIVAHPDDAEFLCAGTLVLLKERGWNIAMATMTAGECGSADLSREEIGSIRKKEADNAAKLIGGSYYCLDCEDMFVQYNKPTILKVVSLIRQANPSVVMTMSPSCYHPDHENTSMVVQNACFSAGIKNIKINDQVPIGHIPTLYYMDPMEGKDKFGVKILPGFVVDISSVIDTKEQMLACHQSQRKWLHDHHGMDEYLSVMRRFSESRGKLIHVDYGEGFRQHLGHSFPQENILEQELGELVYML